MNNSFTRLIDGMCATLRNEVLSRLDDDFARGQVFGVINLLNTFKVRADWSAPFLLDQIAAQQSAIGGVLRLAQGAGAAGIPTAQPAGVPASVPIAHLLELREQGNRAIGDLLAWLAGPHGMPEAISREAEQLLRQAMLAEVAIELKNSPRPLFAEMSSGREQPPGGRN